VIGVPSKEVKPSLEECVLYEHIYSIPQKHLEMSAGSVSLESGLQALEGYTKSTTRKWELDF